MKYQITETKITTNRKEREYRLVSNDGPEELKSKLEHYEEGQNETLSITVDIKPLEAESMDEALELLKNGFQNIEKAFDLIRNYESNDDLYLTKAVQDAIVHFTYVRIGVDVLASIAHGEYKG